MEDFKYAESKNGSFLENVFKLCESLSISIVIGFLEKSDGKLYDSLIFFDYNKKVQHAYRRIDPGWKGRNCNSDIYKEGLEIKIVTTIHGKFALLICGDLFNENIIKELKKKDFDYFIHLLVRHDILNGKKVTAECWEEEFEYSLDQYKLLNCTSFVVNLFGEDMKENNAFGGAWIISPKGELLAKKDIYEPGILYYEV